MADVKTVGLELTSEERAELAKFRERKNKQAAYMLKKRIWRDLMVAKALKAGLKVGDDEVEKEIKRRA